MKKNSCKIHVCEKINGPAVLLTHAKTGMNFFVDFLIHPCYTFYRRTTGKAYGQITPPSISGLKGETCDRSTLSVRAGQRAQKIQKTP
jgi:hypothetical protein